MLDYSRFNDLFRGHHYREATYEARRLRMIDPKDAGPVGCLAKALLAIGDYSEALPLFDLVDVSERSDTRVSGQSGRRIWISCIHWMIGEKNRAIHLMTEMVDGIIDGSIEFGDAAGGVQQGLLLYYMGISAADEGATSKALSYLRTRVNRFSIKLFPGPVARYYLEEMDFSGVLAAATKGKARDVLEAIEVARGDLLSRRWVSVALFHDGVIGRARGDEVHCRKRMRECFSLENPLLEPEWYLARNEVERSEEELGLG